MHALTLNNYLFDKKIKQDSSCYYCNEDEESVIHFFWYCPIVNEFWSKVRMILTDVTHEKDTELSFNVETILFNNIHQNLSNIANSIRLIAKYYIFKIRYTSNFELNEHGFRRDFADQEYRKI